MNLITKDVLRKWGACTFGYETFCRLLPDGATLQDASKALIDADRASYSNWLWVKAKEDSDFVDQTSVTAGYMGTATAGDRGTATAGYMGTATAGDRGTATAGYMGVIVIQNHNRPFQLVCSSVDGDKIKPNTPYRLDDNGNFVEVVK